MSPKKIVKRTLSLLRKVLPSWVFQLQHYIEARISQVIYKNPSSKMIIIGIVGSKGKTTTANILWQILNTKQTPAGLVGTADIKIGSKTVKNHWHKTMPGRWHTQKLLRRMYDAKCMHAVLEVPSEAQQNWRHIGINFDLIIFTNVTNEILAVHKNSLELLHKHNKRLLRKFDNLKQKTIDGKKIPKVLLANKDSEHFNDYTKFNADQKYSYSVQAEGANFTAHKISADLKGSQFELAGQEFKTKILGQINISNTVAAIAASKLLGVSPNKAAQRLIGYPGVPGRMNLIDQGQDFTVLIDYAHEESGLQHLMDWAKQSAPKGARIISLICGQGGGRDVKKRPIMGEIATKFSHSVVVSNDDVYDDDPQQIIQDIIDGCKKVRPSLKGIYNIEDRREGIRKCLQLAKKGDLVLITGKGVDNSMIIAGVKIPWNEQEVVEEVLIGLKKNSSK